MKIISLFFAVLFTALFSWAAVDLNTASSQDLEALPGIGKKSAQDIIAARPFRTVEDLKNVKGIGEGKFQKIQPLVTVSGAASAPAPTAAAQAPAPTASAPVMPSAPTPAPVPTAQAPQPAPAAPTAAMPAARAQSTVTARASNNRLAPGTIVNINTASSEQLEALPGIGPVKAQAIIQNRPFSSVDDLKKVRGIKDGTIAKIRPFVSVQ